MAFDLTRNRMFSRRAALLVGGKLALFSVLAGRLYYLQVVDAERYKILADENRISVRLLQPPRGLITDRFGTRMATNRQSFRAVIVPERAGDIDLVLTALNKVLPLSDHERKRIVREIQRSRGYAPVTVRDNLGWREMARVELNAPDLPGVLIDSGRTRSYPYAEINAHVLGYVAAVSENELNGDPLLELPDARIGKNGIEKRYDARLRGTGGTSQVEVNALGRAIREIARQEGTPGEPVTVAIDMDVQRYAYERLGNQDGAIVVLDCVTGEVIAMVSKPSFDPNVFNKGIDVELWRKLVKNPRGPLINKAISGQYPPGSTLKGLVALAALESGLLKREFGVSCRGYIEFGNNRFHCWREHGHGYVTMGQAIKQSCDVYFYEVARHIGIDRLSDMWQRFGFGKPTGIDLPHERPGLAPSRQWKLAATGVPWQQGETLVASIGQGYFLATPLQLAVAAAMIGNGGKRITPRLIRDEEMKPGLPDEPIAEGDDPGAVAAVSALAGAGAVGGAEEGSSGAAMPDTPANDLGVSSESLAFVAQAMAAVTNEPGGTAYAARIPDPKMAMAGKTGTSQVRRISRAERLTGVKKNSELKLEERDHALFIAFAPVYDPRYAIAVVVEHGGGGAAVAAPIARDIMIRVQQRDPSRTWQKPESTEDITALK